MGIINAIFQAIIQGLTEFLPVSSSGHLSLYQHFTGNSGEGALFFSAILHLGTLVAVFVAFRKTIWDMIKELGVMIKDIFTGKFTLKNMNPPRRMIVMIIVSCFCLVPFLPFKGWFEGIAEDSSIFAEGLCFLYTSAILFMSDRCVKGKKTQGDIAYKDAITSVKYSFILGIPVILMSCLLEVKDAVSTRADIDWVSCAVGFVVAAFVGLCAIKLVNWLVKTDKFKVFAYYTLVLGVIVLVISFIEMCMGHPISFAK